MTTAVPRILMNENQYRSCKHFKYRLNLNADIIVIWHLDSSTGVNIGLRQLSWEAWRLSMSFG